METCEVTFDETIPCATFVFERAGEDELGEIIFVEEEQEMPIGVIPNRLHQLPLSSLR